jgi:hypothetical protein
MAYNRNHIRSFCTDKEYALFVDSTEKAIKQFDLETLKSKRRMAREWRKKYHDLHQRQRLATQRATGVKSGRGGRANERTEQKAKLFQEVVERFDKRIASLEARQEK